MNYDINRPWLSLDDIQKKYISVRDKNCFLLWGRQTGKSIALSVKCSQVALENPKNICLIIAYTERQAYELFAKCYRYILAEYPERISKGKDKPTKHIINLKNGSKILCYPVGLLGLGITGFTINYLFIDEAQPMDKEVFTSVMPMLAVTGGKMDVSGTPKGEDSFFYKISQRKDFECSHQSSEDNPRVDKQFLEFQKSIMTEADYASEYLAIFQSQIKRLISDEWIRNVCTLKREGMRERQLFLGCDIGGKGGDDSTFEILDGSLRDDINQVENIVIKNLTITQNAGKIKELEKIYRFRQVGIDNGGKGEGVLDILLLPDSNVKNKVIGLDNATKAINRDDNPAKIRLMKEAMYLNMQAMGEQGKLHLLDDDELILSLKSIQNEWIVTPAKKSLYIIYSDYGHIAEGIIRACWLIRNKPLDLWFR